MAELADVQWIALSLPKTCQVQYRCLFFISTPASRGESYGVWMERVRPNKPRVPQADVVAIRVADELEK